METINILSFQLFLYILNCEEIDLFSFLVDAVIFVRCANILWTSVVFIISVPTFGLLYIPLCYKLHEVVKRCIFFPVMK